MVMYANFVITKMPILACWASSHRGKNWLTDQKIQIFKVHSKENSILRLRQTFEVKRLSLESRVVWYLENFQVMYLLQRTDPLFPQTALTGMCFRVSPVVLNFKIHKQDPTDNPHR